MLQYFALLSTTGNSIILTYPGPYRLSARESTELNTLDDAETPHILSIKWRSLSL